MKIFLPHERDTVKTEEAPVPESELTSEQRKALEEIRELLDSICNADEAAARELAVTNGPRFVSLARKAISTKLPKCYLDDLLERMRSAMK